MSDHEQLRDLAARYAQGVDARDREVFLSVFVAYGRLRVFNPAASAEPTAELIGHDQLADVVRRIARFPTTFHFVGNATYQIDGDSATGEVYCTAHHLSPAGDNPTDLVMFIRYGDTYRREDAEWKITDRRVQVDWTETHAVDARR